jgi:hypothetical protein
MIFVSNILLIILQTYSKKIDTTGIEIIIVLIIIVIWFLMTGGKKVNNNNFNKKNIIKPNNNIIDVSKLEVYKPFNNNPVVNKPIIEYKTKNSISEVYPIEIQNKILDKEFMDSIIEICYTNPYIDLKKYHKEHSFSEYWTGKLDDLDSLKLSRDIFGNDFVPEFWFIKYNKFLYIFNGEIIIPCSGIMKREDDCLISIFYIPNELKIKLTNRLYFDVLFYDKIFKKITSNEVLVVFLDKLNFYMSGHSDEYNLIGYNSRFVFETNFDFKQKITILDNLNSLEFFTRLFFTKIDYIPLNIEKLLNSFYNYDTKDNKDIIKITKTSLSILSQDEILKTLVDRFNSKEEVLKFFNYEIIEEYLSTNKLKNNHENNSSILSTSLFSHNYINKLHYSKRNYNEERIITEQFRKFKMNFYRTITPKLREIESEIRVSKGFNIVGSFTNESILFTKLKETYKEYNVISQGSPKWLGRQRIDIYFTDLNIGIEYQGDQHFLPISYFGGEEGLKQRIILDSRKEKLCLENNCKLFCVDKNYSFEDLKYKIDVEIEKRIG